MTATAALHRAWALDLDLRTLYDLLRLRVEVFVVEQACPYPELDGQDLLPGTKHLWIEQDGQVVCTLRLVEEHDGGSSYRIGRLCTRPDARGHGHTTRLLRTALAEVGSAPCRLSAQSHLVDMYAKHGFTPDGEEFVEDGIPHVPMRRGGGEPWREG